MADQYAGQEVQDTSALSAELDEAARLQAPLLGLEALPERLSPLNAAVSLPDALQLLVLLAGGVRLPVGSVIVGRRMRDMQTELDELTARSQALTDKIELARELPATILAQASIPVEGLTVKDGVPLIHGLPISNLSDGELLELSSGQPPSWTCPRRSERFRRR